MTAWGELVATAVVGTARRDVPAGAVDAVTALVGPLDAGTPPEQRLLALAGVLAAYRRAGWRPPTGDGEAPPPAPPHDRPEGSERATQLLDLLLADHLSLPGSTGPVVAEWLERCAAAGRRPPDGLLPGLLEVATVVPGLRDAVSTAGGARLRWLAARNPDWRWASGDEEAVRDDADLSRRWATGDRDIRTALLERLRVSAPDAGRALLEETWTTERAADRAGLLSLLATNLGPGDEPFLEAALDDRAKSVRGVAADLLARMPSSRLAHRMAERLRALVHTGGRFRRRLDVDLPEELDSAAARDGVTDEGAPSKTGPGAWRLTQIVSSAPLTVWSELTGATPEEVVRLGAQSPELRRGWATAAIRQGDAEWARLLLPHRPDPALLTVLPPAVAHEEVAGVIAGVPDIAVAAFAEATPGPWPPATSQAVLRRLQAAKRSMAVLLAAPILAARLDPAGHSDVEDWIDRLGDAKDGLRRELRSLAQALSIRATIAEEFPEP